MMALSQPSCEIVCPFLLQSCETHTRGIASYPTRREVDSANSRRLQALEGDPMYYWALDAPGRDENGHEFHPERVGRALKDLIAPKELPLKVGAQVMLIKVGMHTYCRPAEGLILSCCPPVARGHRTSFKVCL